MRGGRGGRVGQPAVEALHDGGAVGDGGQVQAVAAAVARLRGREGWGEMWGSEDTREGMQGDGRWWRRAVAAAVARL